MIQYKQPKIQKLISLFIKHDVMESRFIEMWQGQSVASLDRLILKMENLK